MWKLFKERWYVNGGVKADTHVVETQEFESLEEAQEVMKSDYERLNSGTTRTSGLLLRYSFIITRYKGEWSEMIQYGILKGS